MHNPQSILGIILLFLTAAATYQGLSHSDYQDRYSLWIDGVLLDKQYDRLISSGFLHINWIHFGFNMAALLAFSWSLERIFGPMKFLLLYFFSLVAGNILALYLHRNHGDYRGVGASGAISGVIMASIVLFPQSEIGLLFIPIGIKGWIFGLLFMLISIFGIKRQSDNIGHEAHLGGAIAGVIMAVILQPSILQTNWWIVLAILIPVTAFLLLVIRNPAVLMIDNYWGETAHMVRNKSKLKRAPASELSPKEREAELNRLLEKVHRKGYDSLTQQEQQRMDELS